MHGLVLAGGKGSRMGREKGSLLHPDGRSFLKRTVDLLREVGCERIVVSLREGQAIQEKIDGVCYVRDSGNGPLDGIIEGLVHLEDGGCIVTACDLPALEVDIFEGLCGHEDRFVVYRSEFDGGLEPLCGFYGNGALNILETARERGEWGLRRILSENEVKILDLPRRGALLNVNHREEFRAFLEKSRDDGDGRGYLSEE
ncbi:molybdenum cofactor guanylyltransferase [Luteolibacter algae]|uniref:Molybdenum cofactor guanylyltransferase n=1 Tax=Luteolibacter algae TaxID=454151 RepID=A0ABW5D5H0_9BACT